VMATAVRAAFVGRTRELEEISDLLASTRLLTLMGVGGVGKTRLALEAAERLAARYPDGVFVCELAPVAEPEQVAGALTAAFGLPPEAGAGALRERLAGSVALLVADNCEHVREAAASAIAELLGTTEGISVLATSRERLRLPAETTWMLPPLTPDDSLALLVVRTAARAPRFRVGADDRAVLEEICRRLDGLPLAIELAAARLAMLAPAEVSRLLDNAMRLLTGGEGVPRHRTMREALEWSARLLEPHTQNDLWQLSVFPGAFTLAGAAAVLDAPEAETLDRLAKLLDVSLLVSESRGPEARFRLLEPVRQFAAEGLDAAGQAGPRRRHAEHVLAVSEWIGRNLFGERRQAQALDAFRLHLPDIRQAVVWSLEHEPPRAAQILGWTGFAWEITYRVREAATLMRRCEPFAGSALDRARLLVRLGSILRRLIDKASGDVWRRSLEAAHEAGDPRELGFALAYVASGMALEEEPQKLIAEALSIADREGDRLLKAFVRILDQPVLSRMGLEAEARASLEDARAIGQELGDDWVVAQSSTNLIGACLWQGDNSAARRYLRPALKTVAEHPDWANAGALVWMSAVLAARTGRAAESMHLLGAIKRWQRETGLRPWEYHRLYWEYDVISVARAALPARVAEAALQAGEALKQEEAIALARSVVEKEPVRPDDRLTKRELEIVRLVASGLSNKEIAARLHRSVRTVEGHVERVLRKLDLRSRVGIGTWAIERGLLEV
jgi:predicted ATPase/DNA-binding CsgD family transcriptional regulator